MKEIGVESRVWELLAKFVSKLEDKKLADNIISAINWLNTAEDLNLIRIVCRRHIFRFHHNLLS